MWTFTRGHIFPCEILLLLFFSIPLSVSISHSSHEREEFKKQNIQPPLFPQIFLGFSYEKPGICSMIPTETMDIISKPPPCIPEEVPLAIGPAFCAHHLRKRCGNPNPKKKHGVCWARTWVRYLVNSTRRHRDLPEKGWFQKWHVSRNLGILWTSSNQFFWMSRDIVKIFKSVFLDGEGKSFQ